MFHQVNQLQRVLPSKEPTLVDQQNLNHIVAKLGLSKKKSEWLASWLKSSNLLAPDVRVTFFRNRQIEIQKLFTVSEDKTFAYCSNIYLLMAEMGINYIKDDWRLFIDSNKTSLKAILFDKDNQYPGIPIAYCTDTKETYKKMDMILKKVGYGEHGWEICCDLKVVNVLAGLQGGYTKHMCFLCDWDSRYKGLQYEKHDWKDRTEHTVGQKNVQQEALVKKEAVLLPPLHVKLGLVQSFVKTVAKRPPVLDALKKIFPGLTKTTVKEGEQPREKLKQGVLNGPDIRRLIYSIHADIFTNALNQDEKKAWTALKAVIDGFLGKKRSKTFKTDIKQMLKYFERVGVNMSLKIHYLHHHLEHFSQQLSTKSDEHGERYHQIAIPFELR